MNYITNPYLPEYEYIPDGEPHVFGDRVYIYGSHDRFNGKKFSLNDYVCYSAPVTDLTDWTCEGVIYRKTQDPRMSDGKHELWAPDVVQGKDGRYYLYYCPDDSIKTIGVAVCDTPAGQYEFFGIVQDAQGGKIGERPGDTIQFDPGVFLDDDGQLYLYSGNGPRTSRAVGKEPKASVVMKLQDDMITIASEPKKMLPTLGESEGTGFEGHEFFEATSIRKIRGKYYLVYSSRHLHELCYAVSDHPDGPYAYGGVLVSNADKFADKENDTMKNSYGNNHGGIEYINGNYYIFYHRPTNRTMYSRQGWAERLTLKEDGTFDQVEMTSCGLNNGPLPGKGKYSAAIACHLYGKHEQEISHPLAMGNRHPYVTQDAPDYSPEVSTKGNAPRQYITNAKNGFTALYRYFDCQAVKKIRIKVRGSASGLLTVGIDEGRRTVGQIKLTPSKEWNWLECSVEIPDGVHSLSLHYSGRGKFDFMELELVNVSMMQ